MKKKKLTKPRFYSNIKKEQLEGMYHDIGNIGDMIGMNIYSDIATLNKIKVMNSSELIIELNSEDFECSFDLEKEVKKHMIKNNLFLVEFAAEDDYLIIYTTDDLQSMLYANDEDFEEIKQELNQENNNIQSLRVEEKLKSKSEIFREIISSKYSNNVETEKSELELITEEILQLKRNMVENTIILGIKLKQVKDNLEHGEWIPWLEEKVDFSTRTAQKFIKIATEYENTKATSHLGIEKLYTLLGLPKEEREEFISTNNIEEMSTRELSKKIKEIKDMKKTKKKATKVSEIEKVIEVEPEVIEPVSSNLSGINIIIYDTEQTIAAKDINDPIVITKNQLNRIKFKAASKAEENLEISLLENKTIVDTEKVLKKVDNLIKEIKIRTGDFYTNNKSYNDIKCDDRGGVIAQLYAIDAISEQELIETVKTHNIDLEINFKELISGKAKENYLKNVSNSYSYYYENETYLDVVDSRNLSFENTTDFSGWCDDKSTEDFKKNYKADKDGISILVGYDDNGDSNLCIYKDKKLMGHYYLVENWNPLDEDKELLNNIKTLERFVHIELAELFEKWLKQYTEYFKREQKRQAAEAKEREKRQKYDEMKKEFEMKYGGKTSYKFEDIYDENCSIKDGDKYKVNQKQYIDYLYREQEQYKNYDFGNMFGTMTTYNTEEKDMLKKFYKTLALNYHPDKTHDGGEMMKFINSKIKPTWGI